MPAWPLDRVISGGQTGADQAGISAAKFLNYTTGGRAPKDFMTEEGPAPWLAEFGLQASPVASMKSRTYHNVVNSDGTVIFTGLVLNEGKLGKARKRLFTDVITPQDAFRTYGLEEGSGSWYTAELAIAHHKHLIINPSKEVELREWIYESRVVKLNVAGTRESKAPGIFDWVYQFLIDALIPF